MKSPLTYLLISVIIFLVFWKACSHPAPPAPFLPHEFAKLDTLKAEVKKADTVRTQAITRWRTVVKTLTVTAPCDSVLPVVIKVCDSIIVVDSAAIAARDAVIRQDSVVVTGQVEIIGRYQDSLSRKQRRSFWRGFKWGFGAGAVSGVVAGKYRQ